MAQVTYDDVNALIAFSIYNNKDGVIVAMNQTGNFVPLNISSKDLYARLLDIFSKSGIDGLRNILSRVSINKTRTQFLDKIFKTFIGNSAIREANAPQSGEDPKQFGSLLDDFGNWYAHYHTLMGDFIGGSTTVTPNTQSTTIEPPIKPATLIWIAVSSIIIIILLIWWWSRKKEGRGVVLKWGIIAIIATNLGLVLYSVFGKTTVVTNTGAGKDVHGGVGSIISSIIALF